MNNTFFYSKMNKKDIYLHTKKTNENIKHLTKTFIDFVLNFFS